MSMLTHLFRLKPILLVLILAILLSPSQYSTRAIDDFQKTCQFESLDQAEKNLPQDEYRKILQSCLDYYERYYQIQEGVYQTQLDKTQGQRQSLESELSYLESKINTLKAQTQRSQLVVRDLNVEIGDKVDSINITQERIEGYRQELADIIQLTHQYDQQPITLEILAGGQNLSDIFRNFAVLDSLSGRLQELLKGAEDLKIYLKDQQDQKEIEKNNLEQEIVLQSLQEEGLHSTQESKDSLLEKTKGQEDLYQEELIRVQKEAEKKVGELKSRIFNLLDASREITEYEAIEIAEWVADKTGIQPAFLLAIIEQESALGRNVGECYLTNLKTGEGVDVWGNERSGIMKAVPRSWENNANTNDFFAITEQLGLDWEKTPVSCPLSYGYGGAMGPAQFIPSTWMLYKRKIEQNLGGILASPWVPEHAFLAAALKLVDDGADGTGRGQYNAAAKYYGQAGFYCKQVLDRISGWEEKIRLVKLTKK